MKGKPTSLDIAYLAGVSQPTVSRALRGSPTVNEATRQRILAIANELNYKVDKHASSLRRQQAYTLALLFFEDPTLDDSLINPFFLSMLGSLTRACGAKGYDLIVSFQEQSSNWHAEFEDSKKADGIILLGYGDFVEYSTRLEQLVAQGTHFVRWGAVQPGQPGISIGCDNQQGGADLTRHLIEQGCTRIGFLGSASEHYPEFLARYSGYGEALQTAGMKIDPTLQVDALTTERAGYEAAHNLLARTRDVDALFCASDLIAIGAMRALQELSIDVPGQIAVAGFDDISAASFTNPSLTTVQQNTKEAATLLVDTLLSLIHNEPVVSRMISAPVVVRQSTLR